MGLANSLLEPQNNGYYASVRPNLVHIWIPHPEVKAHLKCVCFAPLSF